MCCSPTSMPRHCPRIVPFHQIRRGPSHPNEATSGRSRFCSVDDLPATNASTSTPIAMIPPKKTQTISSSLIAKAYVVRFAAVDLFETANRRILTLKPGKERLVANRHPWIFAGAIARESGPEDAAIADLHDPRGRRIASGFHSRHSQIRLRALTFGDEVLTEETIRDRLAAAIGRRAGADAARLVNAEGDDISGIVVDRYNDILVIEIANAGIEQLRPLIINVLQSELTPRGIWFKNDIPPRKIEELSMQPEWVGGGEPSTEIRENGLRFC